MKEILTLLAMTVGLSADAFAVTISDALTYSQMSFKRKMLLPTVFGLMQGVMPLIGYGLGFVLSGYIEAVDHWVALVLLTVLGVKMIVETAKELVKQKKSDGAAEQAVSDDRQVKTMGFSAIVVQGIATSIDALAVGITIAVAVELNVFVSAAVIAAVTFVICFLGLFVGKFAKYLKGYAGIIGGIILVAVGIKIFVEHMIGG